MQLARQSCCHVSHDFAKSFENQSRHTCTLVCSLQSRSSYPHRTIHGHVLAAPWTTACSSPQHCLHSTRTLEQTTAVATTPALLLRTTHVWQNQPLSASCNLLGPSCSSCCCIAWSVMLTGGICNVTARSSSTVCPADSRCRSVRFHGSLCTVSAASLKLLAVSHTFSSNGIFSHLHVAHSLQSIMAPR